MSGFDFTIRSKADLIKAVEECGIVPFFANSLPGFSVEEHAAPGVWYTGSSEWLAWNWKGEVIRETGCAYGKFLENKAVFISRELFPDFANYRRDGYDFDARYDEGLAQYRDKELYELLDANAPVLSKSLKAIGNYRKDGKKGFESIVTRLQAQGYVLTSDFVYARDKYGKAYGWGIAEYSTPEKFFGDEFCRMVYRRSPEESYRVLFDRLRALLPRVDEKLIRKILK